MSCEEKLRNLVFCLKERRLLALKKGITRNTGSRFLAGPVAKGDKVVVFKLQKNI